MKNQFLISILFCLALFSCTKQNMEPVAVSLVGKWKGQLFQNGGGTSSLYSYELTITEHTGTMVMGNAYIRDNKDNTLFAHKNLMGTFQNNKLDFNETDIMHQNAPVGVRWLLLSCKTVYRENDIFEELNGTWSSGGYSGNISLTKAN
jgi:hypothetical protein